MQKGDTVYVFESDGSHSIGIFTGKITKCLNIPKAWILIDGQERGVFIEMIVRKTPESDALIDRRTRAIDEQQEASKEAYSCLGQLWSMRELR